MQNTTRNFRLGYCGWLVAYYHVANWSASWPRLRTDLYMQRQLEGMRADVNEAIARMEASETI